MSSVTDMISSMTEPCSPFADLPLDPNRPMLRLWQFVQNECHQPPQLLLKSFARDACPNYIALSYTWGDSEANTRRIRVNDAFLTITENLMDFVNVLRETDRPLKPQRARCRGMEWFWADQISMNQADVSERNHQVTLMGDVYSNATVMFAWLGRLKWPALWPPGPIDLDKIRHDRDWATLLLHMCCSTYWERLWIIQELYLAKHKFLWYGQDNLPAELFVKMVNASFHHFPHVLYGHVNVGYENISSFTIDAQTFWDITWPRVSSLLETSFRHLHTDLEEILYRHCRSQCTDPRDKIYGLQTLVAPSQRIAIDYSVTFEATVLAALRVMLTRMSSLSLSGLLILPPPHSGVRTFEAGTSRISHIDFKNACCDLTRKFFNLNDIVTALDFPVKKASALCWSYVMGRFPELVREAVYEALFFSRDFDVLWLLVDSLVSTTHQKTFTKSLHGATAGFLHAGGTASGQFKGDSVGALRRASMMRTRVGRIIAELAAENGFVMFGEFFSHPADWPFEGEQPTQQG